MTMKVFANVFWNYMCVGSCPQASYNCHDLLPVVPPGFFLESAVKEVMYFLNNSVVITCIWEF